MENTQNYIDTLYDKIKSLSDTQNSLFNVQFKYTDEHPNLNQIWEVQEQINHYHKMLTDARDRAIKQVCYNQLMVSNSIKDGRRSQNMKDYVFLTVNPPDQIDPFKFITAVQGFANLVVCEWAHYIFEQRGEEAGDYHGLHAHILFKRARRP